MANPATSTWVTALVAYLKTQLTLPNVVVVDSKTFGGKLTETLREKGIAVTLGEVKPVPPIPGNGRNSAKSHRVLMLRLATISYKDPGGRSELALTDHWDFQDLVLSTLAWKTISPLTLPILMDTGEPGQFDITEDSGRYTSVLRFLVPVPLPLGCNT